jgi:hypothetical protein
MQGWATNAAWTAATDGQVGLRRWLSGKAQGQHTAVQHRPYIMTFVLQAVQHRQYTVLITGSTTGSSAVLPEALQWSASGRLHCSGAKGPNGGGAMPCQQGAVSMADVVTLQSMWHM